MLIVTAAMTARLFLRGYATHLARAGYEVTLVADDMTELGPLLFEYGVGARSLQMRRSPHPLKDLISLVRLVRLIRQVRPDAVVYATPKASLLASIAARMLRVRVRIYGLWGIRFETAHGLSRIALRGFEKLIASSSTAVVANSRSLADRAVELGITHREAIEVLGSGSSHGVDLARFRREAEMPALDEQTSEFLAAQPGFVVGFVGRIHPDKGIDTLLHAVATTGCDERPVRVLLVGADEGMNMPSNTSVVFHRTGEVADVRPYIRVFDVLVLMSLREGFPNVVLEAAAMGVPAIVSDATGCIDSVVDGVTGAVVSIGDVAGLRQAIEDMSRNPAARRAQAAAAQERVRSEFDQHRVWEASETHLRSALVAAGVRRADDETPRRLR
ncbi:glycosyltransferase [Microbacterium sp.]|uniref:glycosyltransferase n=1 Tax=Microbacterium sp. TaxID=51671 RepID=UPI0028A6076D|nr:glycosyltransferase [Microbacterium sp.]